MLELDMVGLLFHTLGIDEGNNPVFHPLRQNHSMLSLQLEAHALTHL